MTTDRGSSYPLLRIPYPFLPVARRAPRLSLEPSLSHAGMFDGGWWPRTRRIERELPELIVALRKVVGPVLHVALERAAWDDIPSRVTVDGHVIRINCFSSSSHTMSVGGGHQDHFLLLVVPPHTRRAVATAALSAAAMPGNSGSAIGLLTGRAMPATSRRHGSRSVASWPPPWPPPLPPAPQPLPPLPPLPE